LDFIGAKAILSTYRKNPVLGDLGLAWAIVLVAVLTTDESVYVCTWSMRKICAHGCLKTFWFSEHVSANRMSIPLFS